MNTYAGPTVTIQGQEKRWAWGGAPVVHEIGPYSIVESVDEKRGVILFHPYVNGKDTNSSYLTLDQSLLAAMDHRHNGSAMNSGMWLAAWKCLRKDTTNNGG